MLLLSRPGEVDEWLCCWTLNAYDLPFCVPQFLTHPSYLYSYKGTSIMCVSNTSLTENVLVALLGCDVEIYRARETANDSKW